MFYAIYIFTYSNNNRNNRDKFLKSAEGFTKLWPTLGTLISFEYVLLFNSHEIFTTKYFICNMGRIRFSTTTLVSVIIFKENINLISIFSITLIIIGVVLLNVLDQDTNCFYCFIDVEPRNP